MAIGSITVDLLAKTGSFETDLNRAAKLSEKRAKEIDENFQKVGLAIGAGLAAGAAAAVAIGNQAVDQLAKLDDAAQKTGASVERLSQIQQTATAFGQDFNEVDSAISRLAKGMATVDSETNKTQKALAALGLSARDAGGALRDPAELLVDVAKQLQGYEDGAAKAALANDLFGKSGANLLPFLNDLSENVDRFKGVSAEAAAEAAKFQDNLNGLKAQFEALAQTTTAAVLPSLSSFIEEINAASRASNGLLETLGRLVSFNVGKLFGKGAGEQLQMEGLEAGQKQFLQEVQRAEAMRLLGRNSMDRMDRLAQASGPQKQALNYTTGNAPKEAKGPRSQYEKDVEAANKLIESLKTQAATFGQSEAEAVKYKLTLQGLPQAIIDTATALQQQVSDMKVSDQVTKAMEEEFDRQQEARAQEAQQIAQSLMTQEQLENDSYNRRIESLKAYGEQSAAATAEANALIEAEHDRHTLAIANIQNEQLQGVSSFANAQRSVDQQQIAGAQEFTSNLYSILEKSGQENSALGKAVMMTMKGLQVAQIILQTESAAAMTYAGLTAAAAQASAFLGPAGPAYFAANQALAVTESGIVRAIGYANAGLVAGMAISGQRANGGPVEAGKQYIVGERGREAFIPTTNGMIVPNDVLEGGGGQTKYTIVNNTRGRIDSVQERRISATEKALIIDEAISAVANDMSNPNGRTSRAQSRNWNVQRSR